MQKWMHAIETLPACARVAQRQDVRSKDIAWQISDFHAWRQAIRFKMSYKCCGAQTTSENMLTMLVRQSDSPTANCCVLQYDTIDDLDIA
jgi:hypothetical protein